MHLWTAAITTQIDLNFFSNETFRILFLQNSEMIQRIASSKAARLHAEPQIPDFATAAAELVSNSLDAGARKVRVALALLSAAAPPPPPPPSHQQQQQHRHRHPDTTTTTTAAVSLIVDDDGTGIAPADFAMLARPGFSSKTQQADDDAARCGANDNAGGGDNDDTRRSAAAAANETLGYKGQALAALSQLAAEVEIVSRCSGGFETWVKTVRGGGQEVRPAGPSSTVARDRSGTTVTVADFGFGHPVRRRAFLVEAASGALVEQVKRRLAVLMLGWPDVELTIEVRRAGAGGGAAGASAAAASASAIVLRLERGRSAVGAICGALMPDLPADALRPVSASSAAATLAGCAVVLGAPCSSLDQRIVCVGRRTVTCAPLEGLLDAWFAHAAARRVVTSGAASVMARSTRLARPAYVLHLSCPRGAVDVGSEADKSGAVFRDWPAVAAVVMDALAPLWGPPPPTARAGLNLGGTASGSGGGRSGRVLLMMEGSGDGDMAAAATRRSGGTLGASPSLPPPPPPRRADWQPVSGLIASRSRSFASIAAGAEPHPDVVVATAAAANAVEHGRSRARHPASSSGSAAATTAAATAVAATTVAAAPVATPMPEPLLEAPGAGVVAAAPAATDLLGLLRQVISSADAAAASTSDATGPTDAGHGSARGAQPPSGLVAPLRPAAAAAASPQGPPAGVGAAPAWPCTWDSGGAGGSNHASGHLDDVSRAPPILSLDELMVDAAARGHPPPAVDAPAPSSSRTLAAAAPSSLRPSSVTLDHLVRAVPLEQVDRKAIIARCGDVLVALDQHAADERVQLEALQGRLQQAAAGGSLAAATAGDEMTMLLGSIVLRPPQPLPLSADERRALQTHAALVREWGWCVSNDSSGGVITGSATAGGAASTPPPPPQQQLSLSSVPTVCGAALGALDLRLFLHQLAECGGDAGGAGAPPGVLRVLRSKACRSAVMFGDALSRGECAALVARLRLTAMPFCCAHGRPTAAPLVDLSQLSLHLRGAATRALAAKTAAAAEQTAACTPQPLSAARLRQQLAAL